MNLLRREGVHVTVIWVVLGSVLAEFASRVRDYIDFDGARYERIAISMAHTHSLVPRINDVNVHYYSLLYPIFIAPFFAHGLVPADFENANIASAYLMSSACIPAFLLTRRVTQLRWAPYFVAVFSVCMPWIVTSMSLMTETASYPVGTWALYAMVVSISSPSRKHDLLAILLSALAFFARGELIVFVIFFPVALVAFEIGRASAPRVRDRILLGGRSLVRSHPLLVIGYTAVGAITLALYLQHRLASVIGIYSVYEGASHPVWGQLPRALIGHLATFSLGVGVVPCVIALGWIGANVVRPSMDRNAHAFACVSAVMTAAIFVHATNFDLVVNAYVHDRFLMYLVPVVLVGAVLGVADVRRPRWSLVLPLALVVGGFVFGAIPDATWSRFVWLDLDTPISTVYRVFALHLGGLTPARIALVALAIGGTALLVVGERILQARYVAIAAMGFCSLAMFFATMWVFVRTFSSPDRNSRSITASNHGSLDWIDVALGPESRVTAFEYPVSSDWFVSRARWVDFEFFNKSLVRDARLPDTAPFDYLGIWFPQLVLHINPHTGAIAESPTRWIVQSDKETRFQLAGEAKLAAQGGILRDAGAHWRLAWRTYGLYDDGWTKPRVTLRMRVYPYTGQKKSVIRTINFVLRSNPDVPSRSVTLTSGGVKQRAVVTPDDSNQTITVCVPANGYGEVRLAVHGSSAIPGDQATHADTLLPRAGGVFIASLSEADEIGHTCSA